MIPFNKVVFRGPELAYAQDALDHDHISGVGPFTKKAEELLAERHRKGRTLLTTSCTHALEMAALLLRLQPGDEVIVPSFTFVSCASAFVLHGATLVFVDVRPDTLNLSLELTEAAITPRTRAICLVHYAGVAAQPDQFRDLADRHGLTLIEDNAHGLFGSYRNRPLGTWGSVSTLSFHETKNITCGEGGAIHINDEQYEERAEYLREKGTDRSKFLRGQVDKYTWVDIGSSWVMADLLAAMLVAQIEQADHFQESRLATWQHYDDGLRPWSTEHNVAVPSVPEGAQHPAHMYHIRLPSLTERTRFIEFMKDRRIQTVFHYQPLHLSPVGRSLGGASGQCPVTEKAADTLVRLPLHTSLSTSEVDYIVESVRSFQPRL